MSYFDQYLESRVLSASPVELVRMMYRGALQASGAARLHFASGDIAARTRALNQAAALVTELVMSLECPDTESGKALEHNLRRLYDYVLYQFTQAGIEQSPQPLHQAETVLHSLLEGWDSIEAEPAEPQFSEAISVSA